MLQTTYEFRLPKGYVDAEGRVHREGVMRLATALDEIEAERDPRARAGADYLPLLLLSRVVTSLGAVGEITPEVIGGLFTSDMNFLQNMYRTINETEDPVIHVRCPHCGEEFTDTINFCTGE